MTRVVAIGMSSEMKSDREMCLTALKMCSHYVSHFGESRKKMFRNHVAKELQQDAELRKVTGL